MKKLKEYLIRLLGGRSATIIMVEKTRRGWLIKSSKTFFEFRNDLLYASHGVSILIKPSGEVTIK